MHDTTDDLLQELAELETGELPSHARRPSNNVASLPPQDILLEATEQAQQAADLAQVAADRTLSLGKEQKESIIEITEALGTWRQASRATLKELQASRRKMSIMVGMTAFLSVATLGGGGWILWQIQKAAESAKADILDLLQTQMIVSNQKTALKLDELAAVVEAFQAELNRLAKNSITSHTPAHSAPKYQAPVTFTTAEDAHIMPDLAQEMAHLPPTITQLHTPAPSDGQPAPAHTQAPVVFHTPSHEKAKTPDTGHQHASHPTLQAPAHEPTPSNPVNVAPKLQAIEHALAQVQQQLKQLLAHQKTLHLPQPSRPISPAALADIRKMIAEQNRQLKIIRAALWKLRQQQSAAPSKSHNLNTLQQAIETLSHQIQQLKAQQEKMRAELAALKQQTAKLATDRPYSYRAPPLNLE